ncbi:MAG: YfiR family protein, partial [Flammeovirgaceae bacterium]
FNTLKSYYDGKPKGAKKYSIKKLSSADEAASCAVVYVGKGKSGQFDVIKNTVNGKPILTITDSSNLGKKGSCINFKVIDGKLKFEMNQASVTASTLKVASQLSSMAILL